MTIPNLHHQINVEVKLARKTDPPTVTRRFFREPVGKVVKDRVVILEGQIFSQDNINRSIETGLREVAEGYVLFRTYDLNKAGIQIQVGDQIVAFGEGDHRIPVNFYFYRFRFRGHYHKGATLRVAWFTDKKPVRHGG